MRNEIALWSLLSGLLVLVALAVIVLGAGMKWLSDNGWWAFAMALAITGGLLVAIGLRLGNAAMGVTLGRKE